MGRETARREEDRSGMGFVTLGLLSILPAVVDPELAKRDGVSRLFPND